MSRYINTDEQGWLNVDDISRIVVVEERRRHGNTNDYYDHCRVDAILRGARWDDEEEAWDRRVTMTEFGWGFYDDEPDPEKCARLTAAALVDWITQPDFGEDWTPKINANDIGAEVENRLTKASA